MSKKPRSMTQHLYQGARHFVRLALMLALLFPGVATVAPPLATPLVAAPDPAPQAQTSPLALSVISARTEANAPSGPVVQGDPITQYEYIINVDNTGDPTQARNSGCSPTNAGYPDSCNWPSIREVPGAAPIFTQGDQDDFNGTNPALALPNGKYLISVLADGYKMGGTHFTVPLNAPVTVELQPHPLPPATMRIKVFEDISPVNGQFDAPAEQGLAGFRVIINDIAGELSADVFGNPLCTTYNAAGDPTGRTNCLVSDANGDIAVPNLGPNRFDVLVVPPDGTNWVETTTLEGSPSWDTWLAEGGTGLDNEFVVAGEPFPWTIFGFTRPMNTLSGGTGGVKGTIVAASVYLPQQGGLPWVGDIWNGFNGAKVTGPVTDAWVALSDLQNGDTAVYVGRANADGTFQINNVPDGNYFFSWWDHKLHYILDWIQVTVSNGQITDLGTPFLTGWFTHVDGYVFNDLNANGIKDAGEPGLANYLVVLRDRDNSEIDRQSIAATTDANGYYALEKAYPMSSWMILEAYNDRYYTTGITYKVDNQPTPTTILGNGVDVGFLPILGQPGRLDWGVKPYDATGTAGGPRNGGIVGTVSYDVTRNELDPQYASVEPWQPGVPDIPVHLYATILCGTNPGTLCDAQGYYELAPDGSYAKGQLLNSATTETWEQPTDCIARDANGNPLRNPQDQQLLPLDPAGKRCIEAPLMGTQFQSGFATLDGNYGFTDGCFGPGGFDVNTGTCADGSAPTPLPGDDYLVEIAPPNDSLGRPLYQVTREEDINVFGGDQFIPSVPPPACAGALHTVDVAGVGADGPNAVVNPSFADSGGSPYEGMTRPLCDVKLVTLNNGKSIAPLFTVFTRVPIPGKWKGYIIDDLSVSTDPQSLAYGEKAGLGNSPIGLYDFTNRLITTIQSDPNGLFEVLLPSTHSVNCPSPSGVCPNVVYMLGNDPGQPGQLNRNYNPQYRTIGASFEIYPGLIIPSDLAPTQIVPGVLAAGSLFGTPPQCTLNEPNNPTTPELFAVSQPYHNIDGGSGSFTIQGQGFGTAQGSVTFNETIVLPVTSWSTTQIDVTIPSTTAPGRYQMKITASNGNSTVNGLTFHVLGSGSGNANNPLIFEVGPGRQYATIQDAVNAASATTLSRPRLVVVYPGAAAQWNPTGAYFENVVINSPIALQGVGPGGILPNGSAVLGSVIDGRGVAGDTDYAENWRVFVQSLNWDGNQAMYEGAVIYMLAQDGEFSAGSRPAIDGLSIQGGDQQGFPNNLQPGDPTQQEFVAVQGGGIFVNAYGRNLQITNNIMQSNGGAYGGAIRLGTPHLTGALADNQNDDIRIAHNRILANGGTNLAGGIAVFSGSERYEIAHNDICGNFSAEYGGGISHYGLSPQGRIHHNRIYFNRSYDEGGGIIIAGELPANPAVLTNGAGPVDIYANLVQNNLSNDDGGGLRFLMSGNYLYNVYNNIFANNVSTHEGGGVSLNDAPQVRFYNNTVMKNITTATAVTSNGLPAPAGLSSSRNSSLLQATLGPNADIFSNPLLFNNIFGDNRAGTFTGATVAGIGLTGDPTPINYWDLGVSDGTGLLSPVYSILQTLLGTINHPSNTSTDPAVVATYDTSVSVQPWRGNPRFVDILMITALATPNLLGDYHLQGSSPALDMGTPNYGGINSPIDDFDGDGRPAGNGFAAGADEEAGGTPPPPPPPPSGTAQLYFSTAGNTSLPGLAGPFDDADVYAWDGTNYSRIFDASGASLPVGADLDAVYIVDADTIYMSFSNTIIPIAGAGTVQDEDVVLYDAGTWSLFFDGTNADLSAGSEDVDAFGLLSDGSILVSTTDNPSVPGLTGLADEDLLRCIPQNSNPINLCTWSQYFDGSDVQLTSGSEDVDGAAVDSIGNIYLTTTGNFNVAGLSGINGNVFSCNSPSTGNSTACSTFSMFFDNSANGITDNLDAIAVPGVGAPPVVVAPPLLLDTFDVATGPLGAQWSGATDLNSFRIQRGEAQSRQNSGSIWLNQAVPGANQEAFMTLTNIRSSTNRDTRWQGLLLKLNGGEPDNGNASVITVRYASNKGVQVRTKEAGGVWILQAEFTNVTFANGDRLGAQALADGTVHVLQNGALIGSVNVLTGPMPWSVANAQAGGAIGATYNYSNGRFDDFGGNEVTTAAQAASAMNNTALGQIAEIDTKDAELDESDPWDTGFDADFSIYMPLVNK